MTTTDTTARKHPHRSATGALQLVELLEDTPDAAAFTNRQLASRLGRTDRAVRLAVLTALELGWVTRAFDGDTGARTLTLTTAGQRAGGPRPIPTSTP